ncbi:hypothetical protein [Paraliobacillus ryukyuensis]|nr:hypothetical protein [Paraliobacillus ryukyuensis]
MTAPPILKYINCKEEGLEVGDILQEYDVGKVSVLYELWLNNR